MPQDSHVFRWSTTNHTFRFVIEKSLPFWGERSSKERKLAKMMNIRTFFERLLCLGRKKEAPNPHSKERPAQSQCNSHEDPGVNTTPPQTKKMEYDISFVRRGTETPDAPHSWKSSEDSSNDNPED